MANVCQLHELISQVAEQQRRMAAISVPSNLLTNAIKGPPQPSMGAMNDLISALQNQKEIYAAIVQPTRSLEDMARVLSASRKMVEQLTTPYAKIRESLQAQAIVFEGLASKAIALSQPTISFPKFSDSMLAWNITASTLAIRMNELGFLAQNQSLAVRMLAGPSAFSEFVRRTTELLASTSKPETAVALRGSLNLAESQLLENADFLAKALVVPEDADEAVPEYPLSAPLEQQNELLSLKTVVNEEDIELLVESSPTAQIARLGRRVLNLVVDCNEASKTSQISAVIFKPTNRLLDVYANFPWLVASDKRSFADFVDCLYFTFYEGAGKDKLRFLSEHGGPLEAADCDFIWCIKHLRNKWTRHDPDHGKEKDILKSWDELSKKLRWLGLAEHPTEPGHFRELQRRLLELAESFLQTILNGLKLK